MKIKDFLKQLKSGQIILLCMAVLFHLSLLFSASNRSKGNLPLFGAWRRFAWDTSGWLPRGGDFYAIYESGNQAIRGHPVFRVQPEMNLPENRIKARMRAPYVATFRYPPLTAYTLGVVLNLFPPGVSYKLWILFCELLIVLGVYLSFKRARDHTSAFWIVLIWLCFYPLHIELYLGQFSFCMGFLIFLCGLALLEKKEQSAISWWGISLFLKVYSLAFVLYWFFRKRAKKPVLWIAVLLITTAIYFLIFPSDFALFYDRALKGRLFVAQQTGSVGEAKGPPLYWGSMGVQRGVLALCRFFYLQKDSGGIFLTPPWARYILFLVFLFPFPFIIMAARDKKRSSLNILSLFTLCWFFRYFDTWEHHYIMLLPLFALVYTEGIIRGWKAFLIYLLLAAPSLWIFFGVGENHPLYPHHEVSYLVLETLYYTIKPVGVVWLFIHLWREKGKLPQK